MRRFRGTTEPTTEPVSLRLLSLAADLERAAADLRAVTHRPDPDIYAVRDQVPDDDG